MKHPSLEEQRELVRRWKETGEELDRLRRERLRGMPYDWRHVDALLQLAESYDGPPRTTSGLVEMQRIFMTHPRYKEFTPEYLARYFESKTSD